MMLFDTHTHLYLPEFDTDRAEVMSRAKDAGVGMMMFPNVDCGTIAPMKRLHEEYRHDIDGYGIASDRSQ